MIDQTKFAVGFTATYIHDYRVFRHLCEIPAQAAVEWVKQACPEAHMGLRLKARELTCGTGEETDADRNGWLNKLFVIVSFDHGYPVALYHHDGSFGVYAAGG